MNLRLTALNVYPIKSTKGIALAESEVDGFGLRYDRRWMVVDGTGQFLTQRSHARLALVASSIHRDRLRVDAPGMPTLEVPLHPSLAVTTQVAVWDDVCSASWVSDSAAAWFSEFLGCEAGLVHMADDTVRPADPVFAPEGSRLSFADGFPFLLISEESLADLNSRLPEPLPMSRFRPNLVVAGGQPYEEDRWTQLEVGGIRLWLVKPCGRCVVTTTDQITGERGKEPLRTLATYRKRDGEVMFGQNVVHENTGRLRVGDLVTMG